MAATDTFPLNSPSANAPQFTHAFAITPADGADLTTAARAIYVGGAGAITLDTLGGETTILFAAVPVGTVLHVRAARVRSTGTTATNLVGLY